MHTLTHVHTSHMHIRICTQMPMYTHTCTCVHTHAHMHIHIEKGALHHGFWDGLGGQQVPQHLGNDAEATARCSGPCLEKRGDSLLPPLGSLSSRTKVQSPLSCWPHSWESDQPEAKVLGGMHNQPSFADGKTFGGQAEGYTKQGGWAIQAEPGSLPALSAPWPALGCPWLENYIASERSRVSARPIWRSWAGWAPGSTWPKGV